MRIEKIILRGYGRFGLRQIEYFEYTPTKKTQAILGSNGCGKSSLMEELSPLPANPKFYSTGGKEIWLTHRGKSYHLNSSFTEDGNRFFFSCDGQELNDGYTVTGYRELVKEHFHYTKEIHQVLTGKVRFHAMSVNERRNWFMAMNELDYDYAVAYHKRLKEHIRSLQGAYARTQERLTHELANQITPEKAEEIHAEIVKKKKELEFFLQHRPSLIQDGDKLSLDELEKASEYARKSVESLINEYKCTGSQQSKNTLLALNRAVLSELSYLQLEVQKKSTSILALQREWSAYQGIEGVDVPLLETAIVAKEKLVEEIIAQRSFEGFDQPDASLQLLDLHQDELDHLLTVAEGHHEQTGTARDLQDFNEQIEKLRLVLLDLDKLIASLDLKQKSLQLQRDEGEAICPNCDHRWIPNYDLKLHQTVIAELARAVGTQAKHQETLARLQVSKEKLVGYLDLRRHLEVLSSRNRLLTPLWAVLFKEDLFFKDSSRARYHLQRCRLALGRELELKQAVNYITDQKKIVEIAKAVEQKDKKKLSNLIDEETARLAELNQKQKALDIQTRLLTIELNLLERIDVAYAEYKEVMAQYTTKAKIVAINNLSKTMQEAAYAITTSLSLFEKQRSQIEIKKSLMKSLEEEVTLLKDDISLLQKAEQALSPTSGLIAKGMMTFINQFVKRTNQYIDQVWLYPLEISPISQSLDDEIDLDYRFAIKVNGKVVTSDANETSEGMKEIINLAFVLASMSFLGLEDYPVFLDEFAVKMDAAHRDAAFGVIDYLAESTAFSQLFLVSHYESGYCNLADAETIVLCPANVALPSTLSYNQNCILA